MVSNLGENRNSLVLNVFAFCVLISIETEYHLSLPYVSMTHTKKLRQKVPQIFHSSTTGVILDYFLNLAF